MLWKAPRLQGAKDQYKEKYEGSYLILLLVMQVNKLAFLSTLS